MLTPLGFDSLNSMAMLHSEHCEMGDNQTISDPADDRRGKINDKLK